MCIIGSNNIKTIKLDTKKGNFIENAQLFELSKFEVNQFNDLEKMINKNNAIVRTKPTPLYNCHGLTFAARRTGIFDSKELKKILRDDVYLEISIDKVLPGDVIIYYSEDGDFEHSGLIVSEPDNVLKIPRVLSKWGKYCEVIHLANMCPYSFENAKFYRMMP